MITALIGIGLIALIIFLFYALIVGGGWDEDIRKGWDEHKKDMDLK